MAIDKHIGAISAVVAVLLIKLVNTQQSINTTNVKRYGDGLSPKSPITLLAIISPAPDLESADANESVPPNKNIVFKSIDFNACFSDITPVTINAKAPIHPVMQSFIPILSSNIIPSNVRISIISDNHCFHF